MAPLTQVAIWIILAASVCSLFVDAPGYRYPRVARRGVWALWILSGLVATGAICAGLVVLLRGGAAHADVVGAYVSIAVAVLNVAVVVLILRISGFWAALGQFRSSRGK